jgi:WD40 repeat protein
MSGQNAPDASAITNNTYAQQQTLTGHTAPITSVTWSPDGQHLVSSSLDGTIRLWHGGTGELLHTFSEQASLIWRVIWSPDGQFLASSSLDGTIRLWHGGTGELLHTLSKHNDLAWTIVWSPDGQFLASGSLDQRVCLWSVRTGELVHHFSDHSEPVISLAWSPDGQSLASGSLDCTVCLWDIQSGVLLHTFSGHTASVKYLFWSPDGHVLTSFSSNNCIKQWDIDKQESPVSLDIVTSSPTFSWSPDGRMLAVDSTDHSILLFDIEKRRMASVLEGHTNPISYLAFSLDGQSLVSFAPSDFQQWQGTIRIWYKNADTWVLDAVLQHVEGGSLIAFHPRQKAFALPNMASSTIAIWRLDDAAYSIESILADTIFYRNAKVVLVGDSGVGKSGLGLVLTDKPFMPTDSTHGRYIWTFGEKRIFHDDQCTEIREILLWDLAGQTGYRIVHQLHLDEVNVALIVFDSKSETDPFAGVVHWERALRQAQYVQQALVPPVTKFLVAARVDRGGISMSDERVTTRMQKHNLQRFFATSAKEDIQIKELKAAIEESIRWEDLPVISSTRLFQTIRTFLIREKESGRLLDTISSLYRVFLLSRGALARENDLRIQFETCIGRIESVGLIKRLSFGDLVLLQPELLDAYASALINAVKSEPEGFGSIAEDEVRAGAFLIPEDVRIKSKEQEKMLLTALIEDLLRRELVLREDSILVFPSQSTRKYPDLPEQKRKTLTFTFDGPVLNIYATLAVRLANSGMFRRDEIWRHAVTYNASVGGICGIRLQGDDEGHGEISLFFDEITNEQTQLHFEDYIQLHLQRKALPGSLVRRRIFICKDKECNTTLTDEMVQKRLARKFVSINCPVCEAQISLLDREARISPSWNEVMDRAADRQRDQEMIKSVLMSKREHNAFDVFLCCSDEDMPAVKRYGEQLKNLGILPWLAEWELRPGIPRQLALEQQITHMKSAAVFVGKGGIQAWEHLLQQTLIRECVQRKYPVIPVLLPEAAEKPELPIFLQAMRWVDFRQTDPDPFNLLVWGITGENPNH